MTSCKRGRVLFAIGTCALAFAGTGLTLMNNIDADVFDESIMRGVLMVGVAITLAACFTAMEVAFLWGHREIDEVQRLWRKAVLVVTCIVLICVMGFAVNQELKITLAKIGNRTYASDSSLIVSAVRGRYQSGVAKAALKELNQSRIAPNATPFIVGYVCAGIAFVLIGAVSQRKRNRRYGAGNLLLNNDALAKKVQVNYGLNPAEVRAYLDRNGKGANIWHKSRQIGYLSFDDKTEPK